MNTKKLSLVVPVMNEQDAIPLFYHSTLEVVESLSSVEIEFMFVDDGSIDETLIVIKSLAYTDERVKYKNIIIYLLLGLCTTIVNVAAYFLCYECLFISNVVSTIIAWVLAVLFAFLTNKPLVFNSRQWMPKLVMVEGAKFFSGRFATGALDIAGMYILVNLLHLNGTLMKLLLNIIIVIFNYVFSKFIVFNKK